MEICTSGPPPIPLPPQAPTCPLWVGVFCFVFRLHVQVILCDTYFFLSHCIWYNALEVCPCSTRNHNRSRGFLFKASSSAQSFGIYCRAPCFYCSAVGSGVTEQVSFPVAGFLALPQGCTRLGVSWGGWCIYRPFCSLGLRSVSSPKRHCLDWYYYFHWFCFENHRSFLSASRNLGVVFIICSVLITSSLLSLFFFSSLFTNLEREKAEVWARVGEGTERNSEFRIHAVSGKPNGGGLEHLTLAYIKSKSLHQPSHPGARSIGWLLFVLYLRDQFISSVFSRHSDDVM